MTLDSMPGNEGNSISEEENLAAVLALITLGILFFAYCCWGSSCLRKLSHRMTFSRQDDFEVTQNIGGADVEQSANNPTIVLLPHGRILVVDGTIFSRFHANSSGLDLFELGSHVFRQERNLMARSASIIELNRETNIKVCQYRAESPLPPNYELLFCDFQHTNPPSYAEVMRNHNFPEIAAIRDRSDEGNDVESIV